MSNESLEIFGEGWKQDEGGTWLRRLGPLEMQVTWCEDMLEWWYWIAPIRQDASLLVEGYKKSAEEAMSAADAVLLEEIGKFVRVKQ